MMRRERDHRNSSGREEKVRVGRREQEGAVERWCPVEEDAREHVHTIAILEADKRQQLLIYLFSMIRWQRQQQRATKAKGEERILLVGRGVRGRRDNIQTHSQYPLVKLVVEGLFCRVINTSFSLW
jgi:hypothetical protein